MIKQLTSALCGLMLLTGCAVVGPDYRLPPTELGGEFANASQGRLSSDSIDTTWWRGFKDKELDRLVDLALQPSATSWPPPPGLESPPPISSRASPSVDRHYR
jgi:hypothetical protein